MRVFFRTTLIWFGCEVIDNLIPKIVRSGTDERFPRRVERSLVTNTSWSWLENGLVSAVERFSTDEPVVARRRRDPRRDGEAETGPAESRKIFVRVLTRRRRFEFAACPYNTVESGGPNARIFLNFLLKRNFLKIDDRVPARLQR